jgi:hypothetical protein
MEITQTEAFRLWEVRQRKRPGRPCGLGGRARGRGIAYAGGERG